MLHFLSKKTFGFIFALPVVSMSIIAGCSSEPEVTEYGVYAKEGGVWTKLARDPVDKSSLFSSELQWDRLPLLTSISTGDELELLVYLPENVDVAFSQLGLDYKSRNLASELSVKPGPTDGQKLLNLTLSSESAPVVKVAYNGSGGYTSYVALLSDAESAFATAVDQKSHSLDNRLKWATAAAELFPQNQAIEASKLRVVAEKSAVEEAEAWAELKKGVTDLTGSNSARASLGLAFTPKQYAQNSRDFLEKFPDSSHADEVRGFLKVAEKRLAEKAEATRFMESALTVVGPFFQAMGNPQCEGVDKYIASGRRTSVQLSMRCGATNWPATVSSMRSSSDDAMTLALSNGYMMYLTKPAGVWKIYGLTRR